MDLTPYVTKLRGELALAAESGGADAVALAERLTAPLESAIRLTLLEALSAAADEITRDLAPGSVDLRLRGMEPSFVVTARTGDRPASGEPEPSSAVAPPAEDLGADRGGTSRINLRLPEDLKARIEEAAARERLSVNTWLVRAAAGALTPVAGSAQRGPGQSSAGGRRYTGWVR